jgi:hypothetical protein
VDEKYGIELELITNKFKSKMQEVKNAFKGIDNHTVNVNANKAQIEYLKSQIDEINYKLSQADKGFEVGDTLKLESQLEKLTQKLQKLTAVEDEFKKKSPFNNLSTALEKSTSKIRRFGLALLSVRGIYTLLSKASSAYLTQDTELSNRLQAVWTGLGAMLAPVIENIVNLMLKGVKYINIFVKTLTGVDLIAKATAKSMNKTNASAKALSKTLAGFDELTNLDTESAGGGDAGAGDILSAFDNVDIDTTWADRIRQFGEWITDNKDDVLAFIGGVAVGLDAIRLGFSLLQGLGIGIAIAGVIKLIQDVINLMNDPQWDTFIGTLQDIAIIIGGIAVAFGAWPVAVGAAIALIILEITRKWDEIRSFLIGIKDKVINKITELRDNITKKIENIQTKVKDTLKEIRDGLDKFIPGIGIILDTIFNTINSVIESIKFIVRYGLNFIGEYISLAVDSFVNMFDGIRRGFENIFSGIKKIAAGDFAGGLKDIFRGIANFGIGILNQLISKINWILTPIRTLIATAAQAFGLGWSTSDIRIPMVPYLATGTNYVPEDQLAYIHKGEAVVPKKFNSDEYFGSGNEETNALLNELITSVNNIEINPYTTITDVGKNAVEYINSRKRQLGRSVV